MSSEGFIENNYTIQIPNVNVPYKRLTNLKIPTNSDVISINVSRNLLKSLPNVILNNCIDLDLSSNRLTTLNPHDYPILNKLNLSRNHINMFIFQSMNTLTYLNISHNFVNNIPQLPPNLITFICCENKLQVLPQLPRSLQVLKCCNNKLTTLPDVPIGLRVLSCKKNMLTSLPEVSLMFARRLRHLAYDNNTAIQVSNQFLAYIDRLFANLNINATDDNTLTKTVYNDAQNVHNSNINNNVLKIVKDLLTKTSTLSEAQCLKNFQEMNNIDETKSNIDILIELCLGEGIFGDTNATFGDIFKHYWNYISIPSNLLVENSKQEIVNIFNKDLPEMKQVCFTGRIGRMINTLSGFSKDYEIGISETQQIQAKYSITKKQLIHLVNIPLLYNIVFFYKFRKLLNELELDLEVLKTWLSPIKNSIKDNIILLNEEEEVNKVQYNTYQEYVDSFKTDFAKYINQ